MISLTAAAGFLLSDTLLSLSEMEGVETEAFIGPPSN